MFVCKIFNLVILCISLFCVSRSKTSFCSNDFGLDFICFLSNFESFQGKRIFCAHLWIAKNANYFNRNYSQIFVTGLILRLSTTEKIVCFIRAKGTF